ncbi:hypothetical protein L1281_002408, partial [Neisseria sp. HSC-16F19]
MYPIDTQDNVFHDGDGVAEPGTILPAWWLNMMQAEQLALLSAANITPDRGQNNQVLAALNALYGSPAAASLSAAGIVRLSSSTNSTDETMAATPKAVREAMLAAQSAVSSG